MEGGVAFLHTRAKDKGKIGRPFIIVGRSWEGITFGAPDGNPTYLFFLLGLKYDRLHLPILGRLARALRNPATIAKLRSLSSPDQLRALLLKEDAQVRAGRVAGVPGAQAFKPKLDRTAPAARDPPAAAAEDRPSSPRPRSEPRPRGAQGQEEAKAAAKTPIARQRQRAGRGPVAASQSQGSKRCRRRAARRL